MDKYYICSNVIVRNVIESYNIHKGFVLWVNLSYYGQNGHIFAYNIFRCIFVNGKFCNLIKISLKFAPKGTIYNKPALV